MIQSFGHSGQRLIPRVAIGNQLRGEGHTIGLWMNTITAASYTHAHVATLYVSVMKRAMYVHHCIIETHQTRQGNTTIPRDGLRFKEKVSCPRWGLNPCHCTCIIHVQMKLIKASVQHVHATCTRTCTFEIMGS